MQTTIVQNMDKIRLLFQEAKEFCEQETDLETIVAYLEECTREFISIAYESASMVLALRELSESKTLTNWTRFMQHQKAQQHLSQVYVGLGWAVAQKKHNLQLLLEELPHFWGMKTADGAGYFDGIFRNRQAVRGLQLPNYIPEKALPIYYQGLGRSLWYLSKGTPELAKQWLLTFPTELHSDLWRGIGLACAYVGGVDEPTLHNLLLVAGEDKKSLLTGGLLGIESRLKAQSMTENMELCSQLWLKKTNAMIQAWSVELERKPESTNAHSYFDYLKQVELSLA